MCVCVCVCVCVRACVRACVYNIYRVQVHVETKETELGRSIAFPEAETSFMVRGFVQVITLSLYTVRDVLMNSINKPNGMFTPARPGRPNARRSLEGEREGGRGLNGAGSSR